MGLMARMFELKLAALKSPSESAGSVPVVVAAAGDHVNNLEVWGVPGVWTMPPDGTHGIRVPVGGSDRWGAIVATHHYKTPRPTLARGEVAGGSTNEAGTTLMARATFYADGKVSVSNATKDLLTLINGLIDLVKGIVTTGSAATQVVSVASQAQLEAYKAQFAALLKVPV
jgi:phage gp45-like